MAWATRCLPRSAARSTPCSPRSATATRIGGDEFCVIAQISDTAAEKYLSEFLRELTARRVKNEHLPHVSVGYACFNPVLGSVEDAIKRADRMMYHYKRKLKSEALTNDDTVKS